MKILLLADRAEPMLWEHLDRRRLEGIDLVLSCGDLPSEYLSFLTCFTHAPILYIHGNHDGKYEKKPPEGCICIEDTIYVHKGVRILGLGGCMRYNLGPHQYTDKQMMRRIKRLRFKLWRSKGVDILLDLCLRFAVKIIRKHVGRQAEMLIGFHMFPPRTIFFA